MADEAQPRAVDFRFVPSCSDLPKDPLPSHVLWRSGEEGQEERLPDLVELKKHLTLEGLLLEEDIRELCSRASSIFVDEPNVITVNDPVTVVGDLHGQYFDLLRLLELGGSIPNETSYLFLGDYVDRGCFACEIVLYLLALKICYPRHLWMLRGNHESRHLTAHFNFKQECNYKYGQDVYDMVMSTFDKLPLCAVMGHKFFCTHGGLSPSLHTLAEINAVNRFREPPPSGPMCDLMWADPAQNYDSDTGLTFEPNAQRGCSYMFGYSAAVKFLEANSLLCVLRAHEAQDQGYHIFKKHPQKSFPTVITLFSAPNYLDSFNNKGAVLLYRDNVMKITSFFWSEHPYYLPGFMDAFTWSLPFVAEKTCDMVVTMLNLAYEEGGDRRQVIRKKILAVSKVMRMYSVLRNESVAIGQLKDLMGAERLPAGLLSGGPKAIKDEVAFKRATDADVENLKRPPLTPEMEAAAREFLAEEAMSVDAM